MVISTILYLLVALVAILGLPLDQLQATEAPLALLYEKVTGNKPIIITIISLFSVMNGILVQVIMTSRLMYGMGKHERIPKIFSYVHPVTRTPVFATLVALVIMITATLIFPLITLASTTAFIILILFSLVNAGLVYIKYKKIKPDSIECFTVPLWVPAVGLCINLFFLIFTTISLI